MRLSDRPRSHTGSQLFTTQLHVLAEECTVWIYIRDSSPPGPCGVLSACRLNQNASDPTGGGQRTITERAVKDWVSAGSLQQLSEEILDKAFVWLCGWPRRFQKYHVFLKPKKNLGCCDMTKLSKINNRKSLKWFKLLLSFWCGKKSDPSALGPVPHAMSPSLLWPYKVIEDSATQPAPLTLNIRLSDHKDNSQTRWWN